MLVDAILADKYQETLKKNYTFSQWGRYVPMFNQGDSEPGRHLPALALALEDGIFYFVRNV